MQHFNPQCEEEDYTVTAARRASIGAAICERQRALAAQKKKNAKKERRPKLNIENERHLDHCSSRECFHDWCPHHGTLASCDSSFDDDHVHCIGNRDHYLDCLHCDEHIIQPESTTGSTYMDQEVALQSMLLNEDSEPTDQSLIDDWSEVLSAIASDEHIIQPRSTTGSTYMDQEVALYSMLFKGDNEPTDQSVIDAWSEVPSAIASDEHVIQPESTTVSTDMDKEVALHSVFFKENNEPTDQSLIDAWSEVPSAINTWSEVPSAIDAWTEVPSAIANDDHYRDGDDWSILTEVASVKSFNSGPILYIDALRFGRKGTIQVLDTIPEVWSGGTRRVCNVEREADAAEAFDAIFIRDGVKEARGGKAKLRFKRNQKARRRQR